ncbi:GIY-YIG nuclease family protein [Shewanella sp. FJAT-52076]|uniref:GIY-YIG nuclease family protein n=1 Tax=Shewanella sp. FJAT-52076 TaxID=2864202 RepID=UPI001C657A0B|nr:GIY-YIG nuclease family protein [Shewanella sp. FJAT-52076]QYJ76689.1 GIY-YIG nuclease family protein [Shewanella sp. FJAT-52076]
MSYIENLIENCNKAKMAKPEKEFVVENISQLDGIDKAIYIIEEIDGNCESTFIELSKYKKLKQRACPKLNAPSPVLYVGSSTTGVRKRIEQHLGEGAKDTYALHLKYWFRGDYKITIKVFEQPKEVLQIIEDALSYELAPAFGKQGGNSK